MNKKGRIIFESFSSEGPSEFLVVSRARWDEHQWGMQKEESRRMAQEVEEWEKNQGEMGYEGSSVKAPPNTRRKLTSPIIRCLRRMKGEWQADLEEQSSIGWEEAEEMSFVDSAISIPRGPMFWCDNRCSEKAFRFWQFALVVVKE